MNGAELRAWRERLGKDEAWIEGELTARHVLGGGCPTDGPYRRRCVEDGDTRGGVYVGRDVERLTTAYHAALEAEERAQAERGPVEPVCPEGVYAWNIGDERLMHVSGAGPGAFLAVRADGTVRESRAQMGSGDASPALLEYAAALSRHRASVHAASDRQRKLDAVRAAEAAVGEAHMTCEAAHASYRDAEALVGRAVGILNAARREAGL